MTNILLRRRKLGNGSCSGIQAVSTTGLRMLRNDSPFPSDLNYVFRWGCTSTIPNRGEVTIINKASAIHWCSNKKQGRLDMQTAGVSVPETWPADYVFSSESMFGGGLLTGTDQFVLRRSQHSQGRDLWHGTDDVILAAIRENNVHDGYVSRKIDKVAEYRVMVVQNRAAWVAQKTPGNPEDVAWNVAQGGRFDNVRWGSWPIAVVNEALAAAKVSGTDFCGVDVMVDAEGKAYVLEVNSAPSQTSPYRQQCLAKAFDYIVTNGKDHFPDPSRFCNYKDVIHPAVRGPANA